MPRTTSYGCTVTVTSHPDERRSDIRIVGDIDGSARRKFDECVRLVARTPQRMIFVDLADVGFAGAALPHFVIALTERLPVDTFIVLRNPRPMVRWVLQAAGVPPILLVGHETGAPGRGSGPS